MDTALLCCRWILRFGSLTEVCHVEKIFSVSDKLRKPAGSSFFITRCLKTSKTSVSQSLNRQLAPGMIVMHLQDTFAAA